ncbi:MAG: endonuclease V, partial [Halobacteria archaeon]|nr:endonuclease V [Halobacteria archaeon]
PGHRVDAETAVDIVEQTVEEHKLPEPVRRADGFADEVKAEII